MIKEKKTMTGSTQPHNAWPKPPRAEDTSFSFAIAVVMAAAASAVAASGAVEGFANGAAVIAVAVIAFANEPEDASSLLAEACFDSLGVCSESGAGAIGGSKNCMCVSWKEPNGS